MEPQVSLPCSQAPTICLYPEPEQSSLCSKPYLLKICFNLCSHLGLKSHIFPHKNPVSTSPLPSNVCWGVTIHGDPCNVIPPVFCFPSFLWPNIQPLHNVLHFCYPQRQRGYAYKKDKLWHSSRQKWQWTYLQWQPSVELQSDKQDSSRRPQDTSWSLNTSPHYMPLRSRYVNALIHFAEQTTSDPDRESTLRQQLFCSSHHITSHESNYVIIIMIKQ